MHVHCRYYNLWFIFCLKVLEVVRNNYDTLTLKLQDNLDHYEKYSERPRESTFFTQLVRDSIRFSLKHH